MNSVPSASAIYENLGLSRQASTTAGKAVDKTKLSQEQFLKLMLAQLKNQDPTKPLDNAQFLGQIAQVSTVTGIQELQSSFKDFASSLQSNQLLQTSNLVGHNVLAPSELGVLPAGGALSGEVDLPSSTAALTIKVMDGSGQVVRTLEMGANQAGSVQFSWDGIDNKGQRAVPGTYRIKAEALINDKTVAVDTLTKALVESVTLDKTSKDLILGLAGIGSAPFSSVRQIFN